MGRVGALRKEPLGSLLDSGVAVEGMARPHLLWAHSRSRHRDTDGWTGADGMGMVLFLIFLFLSA